jgi:hypothetical protein
MSKDVDIFGRHKVQLANLGHLKYAICNCDLIVTEYYGWGLGVAEVREDDLLVDGDACCREEAAVFVFGLGDERRTSIRQECG